jgi:hypothetical protein
MAVVGCCSVVLWWFSEMPRLLKQLLPFRDPGSYDCFTEMLLAALCCDAAAGRVACLQAGQHVCTGTSIICLFSRPQGRYAMQFIRSAGVRQLAWSLSCAQAAADSLSACSAFAHGMWGTAGPGNFRKRASMPVSCRSCSRRWS